ncbi:MAG: exosortase C-terminal domain/associated protein EpsI [Candidatus Hodarchaeota archaeon]
MINRDKYYWIVIVLFILTGILVYWNQFAFIPVTVQKPKILPIKFGEWNSSEISYNEKVFEALGADITFFRKYKNSNGNPVYLYIGYYEDMEKADLSHAPIICYTGQGWTILNERCQKIHMNPSEISINNMLIQKGTQKRVVFYWYQLSDKAVASHIKQKLLLTFNRLLRKEDASAFIRVSTPVQENNVEQAIEMQKAFIKEAYPYILKIFKYKYARS